MVIINVLNPSASILIPPKYNQNKQTTTINQCCCCKMGGGAGKIIIQWAQDDVTLILLLHLLWYWLCHDNPALILEKYNVELHVLCYDCSSNLRSKLRIGSIIYSIGILNYNFHARFKWVSHSGSLLILLKASTWSTHNIIQNSQISPISSKLTPIHNQHILWAHVF